MPYQIELVVSQLGHTTPLCSLFLKQLGMRSDTHKFYGLCCPLKPYQKHVGAKVGFQIILVFPFERMGKIGVEWQCALFCKNYQCFFNKFRIVIRQRFVVFFELC